MRRIAFLTGVTGFIGGVLARRLVDAGWHVHALVRPGSTVADLPASETLAVHRIVTPEQELEPLLASVRPDVVFHLASLYLAEHKPEQVAPLVESNVLLPVLLAEAMKNTGCSRLINTGTAWQHFEGQDYRPVNLYAATKQAAEDLLRYYADAHGVSITNLHLFDTFGAGDKRRKLIQILIDAARGGEELAMSPGDQIVDLTHVDDVVDAFLLAAEDLLARSDPTFATYFLSGERQSIKELAATVSTALGRPVNARFGGRPYRSREVMEPIATGETLPGWTRKRDLTSYLAAHRD